MTIYWVTCGCYAWPVSGLGRLSPCGFCGSDEYVPVDEPASGKAGPL